MEVNCFQILLIDATFYLLHVQNVILNVLINKWKPENISNFSANFQLQMGDFVLIQQDKG